MTLSSEIFDYLDTLSPAALALDWDNSGLQVGSRNAPVRKILVALDPFEDVCREAAAMGAELVITHHPLFFNPIKSLTDESAVGRAAATLIQNGIGLFSCHTNLDIAPGGVNDCLARARGLENPTVFGSEQLLRKIIPAILRSVAENGLEDEAFNYIIDKSDTDLTVPDCLTWRNYISRLCENGRIIN